MHYLPYPVVAGLIGGLGVLLIISGVQLDELYQGTALATRERFREWFDAAGLPEPLLIDLPSEAMLLVIERPG